MPKGVKFKFKFVIISKTPIQALTQMKGEKQDSNIFSKQISEADRSKILKQSNASSDLASLIQKANAFIKQYEQNEVIQKSHLNNEYRPITQLDQNNSQNTSKFRYQTKNNPNSDVKLYQRLIQKDEKFDFSPIRIVQNIETKNQQQNFLDNNVGFKYKRIYNSSTPNVKKNQERNQNGTVILDTQQIQKHNSLYQSPIPLRTNIYSQYSKIGDLKSFSSLQKSQQQKLTRPYTHITSLNLTGLQSVSNSNEKSGIIKGNYNQTYRPYSTTTYQNRLESYTDQRPISYNYKSLSDRENHKMQSHHYVNRNNLTVIESQMIHRFQETKYYSPYVTQRPFTSYQNQVKEFQRPLTTRSDNIYLQNLNKQKKQTLLQKQGLILNNSIQQQMGSLNISQIKRPQFQSHYEEKRTKKKKADGQDPIIIYRNNWFLMLLLFLLIAALVGLGIYHIRDSLQKKDRIQQIQKPVQQKGVAPTYSDPIPIININKTQIPVEKPSNQTKFVNDTQIKPAIQKVITPGIQIRNDTKFVEQKNVSKEIFPPEQTPVKPKEVPIIFPKIQDYINKQPLIPQNKTIPLPIQQNKTIISDNINVQPNKKIEKPLIKPIPIEPISIVPSQYVQPVKEGDQSYIQPITIIPTGRQDNKTVINKTVEEPIEAVPIVPIVIPKIIPTIIPTTTPTIIPQYMTTKPIVVPSKVDQKGQVKFQEIPPIQVKQKDFLIGYQPKAQIYFPLQSEDLALKPISKVYAEPSIQKVSQKEIEPQTIASLYPQQTFFSLQPISQVKPFSPLIVSEKGYSNFQIEPIKNLQFNETYQASKQNELTIWNESYVEPIKQMTPIPITPTVMPVQVIFPIPVISNGTQIQPNQTMKTNQTQFMPISIPQTIKKQTKNGPQMKQQTPSFMKQYILPQNISQFEISLPAIKGQIQYIPAKIQKSQQNMIPALPSQKGMESPYIEAAPNDYAILPQTNVINLEPYYQNIQIKPFQANITEFQPKIIQIPNIQIKPIQTNVSQTNNTNIPAQPIQKSIVIQKDIFQYVQPKNISQFNRQIPVQIQQIQTQIENKTMIPETTIQPIPIIEIPSSKPFTQGSISLIIQAIPIPSTFPVTRPSTLNFIEPIIESNISIQPIRQQQVGITPTIISQNQIIPSIKVQSNSIEPTQINAIIQPQKVEGILNVIDAQKVLSTSVQPQIFQTIFVEPTKIFVTPQKSNYFEPKPTEIQPTKTDDKSIPSTIITPKQTINAIQTNVSISATNNQGSIQFKPVSTDVYIKPSAQIPAGNNQINIQFNPIQAEVFVQPQAQIPAMINQENIQFTPIKTDNFVQSSIQIPAISNQKNIQFSPIPTDLVVEPSTQIPASVVKSQENITRKGAIKDVIIQTNVTREVPYIFPQNVKRLSSLESKQVIYEIPKDFDKGLLPQLQKQFLEAYNKSLTNKSPFEIIPLNYKKSSGPEYIPTFEDQYKIYYAPIKQIQNVPLNFGIQQRVPPNFKISGPQSDNSPYSINKKQKVSLNFKSSKTSPNGNQTILQVLQNGQVKVLQKGSDWQEVQQKLKIYNKNKPATDQLLPFKKTTNRHHLKRQQN